MYISEIKFGINEKVITFASLTDVKHGILLWRRQNNMKTNRFYAYFFGYFIPHE